MLSPVRQAPARPHDRADRLSRRRLLATGAAIPLGQATWISGSWRAAAQEAGAEVAILTPGAGTLYVAATGHNLAEPFRSRWEGAGGADVLGVPLSEGRYATGAGGVQYMTLVFDPGQQAPFDVRGQRLDKTLWLAPAPHEAFADVPGAPEEWGRTLTGAIAEFWSAFGGEALIGRLLTEPFRDDATGFLRQQPPIPQLDPADWDPSHWQGASLGETNIRAEPTTGSRIVRSLKYGTRGPGPRG